MDRVTWEEVLHSKLFLVNLDRRKHRLASSLKRIERAGFTNVERVRGVDGQVQDELDKGWKCHGSPPFDKSDPEFMEYKGKQGCALSHLNIWKNIIDNDIPFAVVFEDDVDFHEKWHELAKEYWKHTPRDFHVLYLGSQIHTMFPENIIVSPVYCTHAYMITLDGAKRLYELYTKSRFGVRTIDSFFTDHMKFAHSTGYVEVPFIWYVWNATMFPDKNASNSKWAKRNHGLVFQDADLGTDVREW
jgi:GR25 family glycosyltransferase involved in LPS biosynthesis